MKLSDLNNINNLDPNNIGSWPLAARIIVIILLSAAILFAGYYFDTSDQLLTLDKAQAKEVDLKKTFETKQAKAASLEEYKSQMKEMQRSFGTLLKQLPGKTEVPGLLDDITRIGIQSGLVFELFKPGAESIKEFYAELPISIRVTGTYHQFGNFVSGTAALPRIVTLHDFDLTKNPKSGTMTMKATAKTYRYLEESEVKKPAKDKKGKKGKGSKKKR